MTALVLAYSGRGTLLPGWNNSSQDNVTFRVPFSMPRAQTYYWSSAWQAAENAAVGDIESGDFVEFSGDDATDVARWLREPDDDD